MYEDISIPESYGRGFVEQDERACRAAELKKQPSEQKPLLLPEGQAERPVLQHVELLRQREIHRFKYLKFFQVVNGSPLSLNSCNAFRFGLSSLSREYEDQSSIAQRSARKKEHRNELRHVRFLVGEEQLLA